MGTPELKLDARNRPRPNADVRRVRAARQNTVEFLSLVAIAFRDTAPGQRAIGTRMRTAGHEA